MRRLYDGFCDLVTKLGRDWRDGREVVRQERSASVANLGRMSVPTISPAAVSDDALLLDVRESDEWAAGHIPGSVHLPMSTLLNRLAEIPKDRELVVLCKVGARSAQITA